MAEEKEEIVLEETTPQAVDEAPAVEPVAAEEETAEEDEVKFREFPEGTEVVEDDSITDEQASKLLEEMRDGKRYLEVEGVGRLYLRNPTVSENQEGGLIYSKVFNQAILAGIEPSDILEKKLVEKNIIEDDNNQDSPLNKLRKELMKKEVLLRKFSPKDSSKKVRVLAGKIAEIREQIFQVQMKKQSLLSNSAEQRADEARSGFLMSRVTYKAEDDERVWDTYEDYLDEKDYMLVGKVTYEYVTFSYGLASNYMREFPEVQYLENSTK